MGLAILLFLIFAGIEDAPLYGYNGNYPTDGPVHTYAFPLEGTTWVACMNAVLNITFLWVPQILFPTFIRSVFPFYNSFGIIMLTFDLLRWKSPRTSPSPSPF